MLLEQISWEYDTLKLCSILPSPLWTATTTTFKKKCFPCSPFFPLNVLCEFAAKKRSEFESKKNNFNQT